MSPAENLKAEKVHRKQAQHGIAPHSIHGRPSGAGLHQGCRRRVGASERASELRAVLQTSIGGCSMGAVEASLAVSQELKLSGALRQGTNPKVGIRMLLLVAHAAASTH